MSEEQQQFLHMRQRQPVLIAVQRMRHRVRQITLHEEAPKLVEILPPQPQFPMVRLGESPHQQMHARPVFWELRRDFRAQKNARFIRDGETSIERIAVREGEGIHPPSTGFFIKVERLREAVRQPKPAEQPLSRSPAMS